MSKKATEFQKKEMSKMYRGKEIFKTLNTGWIDENVACVRTHGLHPYFITGHTGWRTILPLRLPTRTSAVHHSKNEYTTHRRPMMPTTNRTTPKKMQRAAF